jgi:Xaa-Pro aminopeptidase
VIEAVAERGLGALLVSDLVNVRYVTGYTGSNGLALVGPATRTFVTDFRYVEQAAEEVDPSFERLRAPLDLLEAIAEALPEGEVTLGFDDVHMPVREHHRLRELLPPSVTLEPAGELVEALRAVKEPDEVERIAAAARLADAAFEDVLADGLVGRTEREVAMALEWGMRERGAERAAFETIVAAGGHGALPHAQPRDVEIPAGALVVIDWGAQVNGYCSDCTRTVATGPVQDEAREVYELVLEAQQAGLDGVAAGASGREVDEVARRIIAQAGHGERFGHGLGHGVGLDIHERPRLSQRSQDELRAGMIVTVEPGIYLPGRLGVRIEDLVVVREDGCEVLNTLAKDLLVVD